MSFFESHDDQLVLDVAKQKAKPPRRYKVVLLNDDFTPMDFVVDVLVRFFNMNEQMATQIMLTIHNVFVHLLTSQVLAFGLALNVPLRTELSDPVVAGCVPHQIRVCPELLLFVSGSK
jgi:hypothetical protein